MCHTLEETLHNTGIMVIDGAMSTALEALGCNLADSLWSAKILAEAPEKIKQVHSDYFKAGADCGITASYQATIPGFMAKGATREEAEGFIRRAVELFKEARSEWWEEGRESGRTYPLCLGSVGPYGAYLADGSEYRGHYGITRDELEAFHSPRVEILWDAGADLILFETCPSLEEAKVEAGIAEDMGIPYWISFSCQDGGHTCEGTPIEECMKEFEQRDKYPNLQMVGVNCTNPQYITELIRRMKSITSLPVAVYPNSGEIYDPVTKTWHGDFVSGRYEQWALEWMEAGVSAVGGCCRTEAKHIEEVSHAREKFLNR